jgi:hypothetical protein
VRSSTSTLVSFRQLSRHVGLVGIEHQDALRPYGMGEAGKGSSGSASIRWNAR